MNEKLTNMLTGLLYKNHMITDKELPWYQYGILSFLLYAENIIFALFLSIIFRMFWECLLFLIIFSQIRSYAGGMHLSSAASCFVLSNVLVLSGSWLLKSYAGQFLPVFCIISLMLSFFLCLMAPQDVPAKRLTEERKKKMRKKMLRNVFCYDGFLIGCFIFLVVFDIHLWIICEKMILAMFLTYIVILFMVFVQYIKNRREA